MADFCAQCSQDLCGEDTGDLRGCTSQASWEDGRAAIVVCAGCGTIQVDPEGSCISADCLRAGHQ